MHRTTPNLHPLFALTAALALAACTLPTKLAELSETGDEADSAGSTGAPTTGGADSLPINSGEDGTAATGDDGCTVSSLTRKPVRPNVVLVLDKSGSMVADGGGLWDHDADPNTAEVTRWSSLHEVVETIVTDFDSSINFGAMLFPGVDAKASYDVTACQINPNIDIAVAAANKDAILAGIPAQSDTSLRGGTPVAAGVSTALTHLKTLDPAVPRAIVLVTDGAANCAAGSQPPLMFEQYDASIHSLVEDAFTIDEIPTYVVGVGIEDVVSTDDVDGSPDEINAFERLNDLASEGGKPRDDPDQRFFNTNNQIALAAALDEIATDALTCIIAFEQPIVTPEDTVVVLDGVTLAHVDDCGSESGWVYSDPDGPFDAIQLCGSACAGLKIVGEAEVTVCTAD